MLQLHATSLQVKWHTLCRVVGLLLCLCGCERSGFRSTPRPANLAGVEDTRLATDTSSPQTAEGDKRSTDREAAEADSEQLTLADLLLGNDRSGKIGEIIPEPALETPEVDDAKLTELKLRKLEGTHLTLITDLDSSPEVDELPLVFDKAVAAWAEYFEVPTSKYEAWHLTGFLMRDRQRFVAAGLLPEALPEFLHGYQASGQLWVLEQPSAYYRRHLVLHEGVHGFMKHALGGTGPPWYREGMAELLATHRWEGGQLQTGIMPASKSEVPEWGRIKIIRDEFAAGRGLMLQDVAALGDAAFLEVKAYAWSWAACAYLDGHPQFRTRFQLMRARVGASPLRFNQIFDQKMLSELRELDEQWQLFVLGADYGYDFARNAVLYKPGRPLPERGATVSLRVDRGWQATGYRLLAEKNYFIKSEGRFQIVQASDAWMSEPNGVTLRYYAGLPLGMLVGNVRLDQPLPGIANLGAPIPLGLRRRVVPVESGVLYLKVNDHPGELVDNVGEVQVTIVAR